MSTRRPFSIKKGLNLYVDKAEMRVHRLVVGGLVAFSLIVVQAFISTKIEDVAELISVVSFAIAIPLLVMFIFSYSEALFPLQSQLLQVFSGGAGFL